MARKIGTCAAAQIAGAELRVRDCFVTYIPRNDNENRLFQQPAKDNNIKKGERRCEST